MWLLSEQEKFAIFFKVIVILFCSINPKKTNRIRPQASWFARLAVLEARASKRANLIWLLYLPVIFFVYGFVLGRIFSSSSLFPVPPSLPLSLSLSPSFPLSLSFIVLFYGPLGTTYLQQEVALFVLSGFCVYSVASALFMFPVLQNYYIKALEVHINHLLQ